MAENPLFENFLKEGGIKNKVAPEVGAVGSIFAPQAQYDRYMDPKLGYDVSRDNEDYYGENQGVFEKIAYAVPTFVGNTALNIVGNLSAIPVGIVSAIYNQDASKLIDNSYTQALDNMSDGLADKFKFYRTNEETENSVLGNMFGTGAANFWLNDFLNGASFAIGAIASEAIASAATAATFGGAGVAQAGLTARLISRAGKLFKAADKAADAAGAFKYADDAVKLGQNATEEALKATARAQGLTSLGTLGRQLTFGTAYEASVEARHHMRELKESLTEQALAAQGGGELTSDQLQAIDDQTKSSGTGVFLANMALLSVSNAAQFNHFTYGVKNLIGKNAGKQTIKGLEKEAFKEVVDESGKTILKPAFETWGKLRKTWDVIKVAKNPLTEGLEESLQSVINNGYSEYSMNKLNPYSQKESVDLMESFGDAFSNQFDLGNKEGWKEFMIGAVLGGAGIPMYGAKGVDAEGQTKYGFTLMGGVAQDIKDRKYEREQTRQYAKYYNETASKSPLDSVNIVRNTVRSGIETNSISKQYDEHVQQGNFKEAKDSQEDMGFSFIKAAFDTGRFDTRVEGVANDIMEMDNEEFAKQFGYDNLTDEELQSRKESVVKTYQKLSNDVRSSLKLVDSAMPNINESLRTAIAHSLFKDRRIDDRIQSIVNRVNEIGGFGYKPEKLTDIVKMFADIYAFQPEEGQLVNKKALDDNIKLQELAQEYEKLTTPDPNLTVEESIARNKKAEKIKADIEGIIKKYPSMAGSTNTIDATKNINEYTKFLDALNKVKDAPGINKDELDTIASDLNKLFADKIRYTALHNYLFTKEGQTKYDNIEQALKELFEESIGKSNDELAKDPIFSQKMKLVMEGMGLPASLIEKGKKLNLGILRDRDELEKQAAIDKAKNKEQKKKEKDTNNAKNKKTEASSKVKSKKETVESDDLKELFSTIQEIIDEIDFDNINNSKDLEELKNTKKELEDLKLKLKEELAKGNKESASIKDVIDQIDNVNKGIDEFLSNYGKSKIISDVAEKAYRHGFENLNRSFFVPENATPEEKAFFEDLAKQLTSFTQDQFDNAIQAKALEVRRVSPPNAGKQYELRKGFFYTVPQYISLLYVDGKLAGSIENPQQYMFAVENSNTLIPIDWFSDVENPSDLFLSQISVFNGEYVSGNKLTDNAKVMVTQARAVINFYEQETKNNETIGFDKLNEYFNLSKGASKTDGISRSLEEVFFSGKMRLPLAQINGEEIEGIVLIKSIGGSLGFYILDATGTETPIPVDHPIYKELQKVKSKYSPFLKYGSYVIFNPIQNKFYPADLPRTETWGEGSNQVLSLLNAMSNVDISEDNYEDLLEGIAADKNGNYPVEIPGTGTVLVKLGKTTKGKSIVSARINFSFSEQANTPGGKLFIPTRPTNDKQLFPFGEIDIVLDKTVNLETGKTTVKLTLQFPEKSTTNKAGFIDFYLDSDNFVMDGDKVVGFKPNLDGEFNLFPSTLNLLADTKGRGIKAIESVTCKSIADLFKHINENRLTYAKKTNLGGLENCEINIKEENQEKSGFKLIDGNPLNLTVKENPDGAIKILPKNTAALSKVPKKEVKKETTKKAPVAKPAAMKVEEPVVETETKTPTDSRTTTIDINGEIFDIGLTELQNLVNALSLTDTDTLSRTELNNYMNALKFLTKFKDLKEYVVNYLSAIVESQSKELAPITTYVIGKIFPMTPKTNGVSNKIIKDSFDQVKGALLTSLQTELDTLKSTPQQAPTAPVPDKKADNTISNGDKIINVQTKPVTDEITSTDGELFISKDKDPGGRIYINMDPLKNVLVVPNNTLTVIDKKTGKEIVNKELNPEGAVIFEAMQGRLFVLANINGQLVPFYKSSAGTSGKTQGAWYPFFGYTGAWLVKGGVDKATGKMSYSPEIDRVTTLLNENLVFPDKYIDRSTNTIKNTNGDIAFDFNETFKLNRLWEKEFGSQTGTGTNYEIKGLKENTTSESGLVALITGLNTTELDSSKTPKENSEWFNLISKNAELNALESNSPTTPASDKKAKYKREDFPEEQMRVDTPVTQKLVDYLADVLGVPRINIADGKYVSWVREQTFNFKDASGGENLAGLEFALNAPRQVFDRITKFAELAALEGTSTSDKKTNPVNWKKGDEIIITVSGRKVSEYKTKIIDINTDGTSFSIQYKDASGNIKTIDNIDETGVFEEPFDTDNGIFRSVELATLKGTSTEEVKPNTTETKVQRGNSLRERRLKAQQGKENKDDSDPNAAPFSLFNEDEVEKSTITYEEAVRNIAELLPDTIDIRDINEVIGKLSANGVPAGVFFNRIVYLSKNFRNKGTEYHEAFHAVFRLLFSDQEIANVLNYAANKYGVPSIEQLLDLRDKSADYANLTQEEITQLWYEEKLADDFAKYATTKNVKKDPTGGFFAKMWQLIKEFFNISRSTDDSVEKYFDNILNKAYKNRQVRTTQFPTLVNLSTAAFELYKNNNRVNITSSQSQRITAQTLKELLVMSNRMGVDLKDINDELIIDAFKEVINSKYNPDLYFDYIQDKPAHQQEAIEDKIATFYETLYYIDENTGEWTEHDKNHSVVVSEIRKKLQYYEEIVNETWDVNENEEETPDQLSSIESYKIGGFSSAPAFMRFFMSTVELKDDVFGIGVDIDSLDAAEQDFFITTADGYKIYNGVLSRVADLRKSEILPALMSVNNNKNIEAFRQKLLTEILKEYYLNTGRRNMVAGASYMEYDPDVHTHEELSKTALYNMFLRTFDKARINPQTTYVDQKSSGKKAGTSISIGRANLRGVDQKQLEQWDINWSKKKVNFKNKEDIRTVLNYIKDALFSTEVSSFEDLNKLIVTVKNEFAKLGIELHEDYIKTSYLLARKRAYNKKAKEGDEFAKSALKLLLTVPASLKSITSEMLNGMSNAANNLTDENRLNLFGNIATVTNEEGEQDDITQANTRYRQMAEGNAFFDENVVEANYRNADGETVYSFVEKSYITTFTKQAKNIFTEVFDAIDNEGISQEEASDMLLEKMIEAEFLTSDDYYLAKSRIRLLTKNFLFKNKKDRDIFLNNLDISFIDGLVDRPLKKEKGQINTDVSKGKGFDRRASTFGSMSVRDKLLYNIFNFFNNKSVIDEETVGSKKVETIPVFSQSIGVQSDKNTHFLIDFISKNYVSFNNYTNEFYESVYNLIMGEYTRIMELQDESKDLFESRTTGKTAAWIVKSNLVNGYEDFHYIRKNGVDWYIVDGQVKGVDRDGQVVENTIGLDLSNFRGLQIYNFNPNRYRLTNPGLADQLEALRNGAIEKLTPPSLEDSKAVIKEIMDFQYQRFVKVLVSSNVNALEEIVDDKGQVRVIQKQQLLPSQLFNGVTIQVGKDKRKVKELQETQLKNFFFNYYLNNMGFSQMLRGDKYLSVNDPVNGVKRESKNNASGPNMGVGNTKVAIIEVSRQVMDELQRSGVKVDPNKAIERADAQGISRMSWHSTYLNALGKVDIRIKQIYRKYEKMGVISESDMSYLESKGALMQTLKLVYSADKYLKMSITFLNRKDVSTILPENTNLYRTLVDAKHAAEDNNGMLPINYFDATTLESLGLVAGATYSDIVEKITGLFIPLAGREKLHALLNEMDLKDIDFTIYKSGSKTVNKDVGYFHNDQWVLHPSEFTNSNMREQVVTENLKDEGIDGTQKNQLITSEQYSNAESTFNDKRVKVGDLVQAHDKHLANRIKLQYDRLQRMIIDNNNKAVWDYLLDQFIDDLISSGKNPLVLEYAKSIKNNQGFTTSPQYNLNHPFVETLFQQTFLSFASKNSTKSKANLIKFTLVSDEGINMVRDTVYMVDKALVELGDNILNTKLNKDGSVSSLTQEEQQFVDENLNLAYYNNNYEMAYTAWRDENVYERILDKSELIRYSQGRLETSGEITQSRLQHRVLGPDGKYYSECIVSEWFLKKYGLKVGDKIPDRLLKMLGVRIPTQDKHSMVTLKIVGFKEGLHGNDIHVPMEVLYLSGADFDIDALYTRIIAKLKNEKKFFGDYVKADSYGDALELAFEEFADDAKNSKIYKKNLRVALQNSDVVKAYNALTNELGKRFEAINDRIIEEKNSNYAESLAVGQLINLNDYQYRIENITDTEVTLIDMDTNVSTTYDINTFNSMFSENTETQFEKVNRESNELFAELPEVIQKKYKNRRDLFAEFGNSVFNKFISDLTLTQRLLESELYAENPQLQQFANSLMSISNEFGIPSANYITSVFDAYNDTLYGVIIPNAFRQASGINPDIEEFERKYGRTITRNMEAYNEGKIQNIEPLTISEANNILLEVEMGLVHNSGNKEIAGTPATLSPLREIEKELSQAGVLTDSEHYGEDSPLDHYSFTDSIEQGKRGIGIVAVSNILAQLLYKNNISIRKAGDKYVIDPIFNSKTGFVDNQTALDEILNDEGIRKNDIKSTILSAMTDNAKEVLAGVFNLNGTTLGAFNALLDMGVSLRKSVFFSRQPVLQALSASKVNDRSVILSATDIKTKKRKQKGQFTNEEDRLFSEVLLDAAPRTPFPDNTSPSDFLTEENLKNAILFETHMNDISKLIQYNVSFSLGGEVYGIDPNNETESFELMKAAYNMIQIGSYREYRKLKKIQDYLFHMTKVLSLSKGFPSSFNDIQDIKDSLLKLGIKVSEGDPSDLNSYQLSYVEEYERDRNNYPLTNILEMIDGSNLIRTNIQAMYAVSDISKEFFIMNTDTGLKIYSSIMKSLGPLFGNYSKEEAVKIYPTVLSALTLAAYRKQISDGTVTSSIKMTTQTGNPYLTKMFDLSPLFDVAGNKRLLEKARRSNEADVNLLLKTLNYTTTSYDGVEGSALENRVVGRFVGDSISKRNPEYASELIDAYTRLISNPETRELALAIFNQIVLRDGMMFTRDSLIRHIDPSLMKQLLSTMDDLHENLLELEGITDQEERNEYFIGLFGMEEIAFLDNIQKLILQSTQFSNTLKRLDGKALRSVQKSHFSNLDDILEEATKKKQEEENAEEQEEKRDMASLIRSFAEDVEKDKRLNRKESSNTALYPYTNKDAGKILLSEEEVSTYTSNEAPIRVMTKNEKDSKETYFVLDIFSGLNLPEAAEVKGKIVNQNIKTIKSAGLANIGASIDEESGAIHRHLILSPIIKSDGKIYKLLKFVSAKKINGKNPSIIWNPVSNISQLPDGVIRFAEQKIMDAEMALDYKQEFIFTPEEIDELREQYSDDKLIDTYNKRFYEHVNQDMLPIGLKAVYIEVDSLGTKEVSTIAGTVQQWEYLKKNKPASTKKIEEAPEFETPSNTTEVDPGRALKAGEVEEFITKPNTSENPFNCKNK